MRICLILAQRFWKPFLLALVASIVSFMTNFVEASHFPVFSQAYSREVSLWYLIYNLPWMLALAIPAAFWVGVTFTYARFSYKTYLENPERPPLYHLVMPVLLASLIVSLILYVHNDQILPRANHLCKVYAEAMMRAAQSPNAGLTLRDYGNRGEREMTRRMLKRQSKEIVEFYQTHNAQRDTAGVIRQYLEKDLNRIDTEIQKRYALSVAPIFFALLGIPTGVLLRRRSASMLTAAVIVSFVVYYVATSYCIRLGSFGLASSLIVWIPNLIVLVCALFCSFASWRLVKRALRTDEGRMEQVESRH